MAGSEGRAVRWVRPASRLLPAIGLRWVERRRRRHRTGASRVGDEAVSALESFFPAETLGVARVAIVPRLFGGRLLRLAERLGIPLVEIDRILGITYLDTIVVPECVADPVPLPTLFHELVHVEQARQLGPRGFVERYVRGWLEGGSYRDIPLERDAYDLEGRFRAAPEEPFDVATEIARRLAESGSEGGDGLPRAARPGLRR